ncbi:glycosyltransferase [Kocuria sp. CPCC 205258]|uniref:glycosyltransferase n=1 Tax=Kocuria sp. CPCC 205258 TaxID=3073552 RepID=UPI0034D6E501
MAKRLVIVQSYIPSYRVDFFERLHDRLLERGIQCVIAAGAPEGEQAERGDAAAPEWLTPIKRNMLVIRGRSINTSVQPKPWMDADGVIFGLKGTSLPVYEALMYRRSKGTRIGLWGHVRPYVNSGNWLDLRFERFQMQQADHVFAYTGGGAEFAMQAGINPDKVTEVGNTINSELLREELNGISTKDVIKFAQERNFDPSRAVGYIGGLDASKRIAFLAKSLNYLWDLDPTIHLLVAGSGAHVGLLQEAQYRGQVSFLGFSDVRQKALVIKSSRALCLPGRIGLVAVDALTGQIPILTTEWPFHAPEFEYLVEGHSKVTASNTPEAYARLIMSYVTGTEPRGSSSADWPVPNLENMVKNFSAGVVKMLAP